MSNKLADLQEAIRRLHGCESEHAQSVPIKETFHGRTFWDGTVETFSLFGHSRAKRCYAWSQQNGDGGARYVVMLEIPPVASPLSAVRASIIADVDRRSKTGNE